MKELAKQYDPSQVEDRIYQFWLDGGYFHTEADPDKKPYTIVMPPPNVTGQLHMGHALDNTMQDVLIRTKRMQGYAALWVPGTDHASIATEAKVVEAMRAEGLTKEMVGRDGFLERAWDWKTKYGNRIVSQLKKLGTSCDWQRERFTMDEGCSDAVKEVFVRLYDKQLIYRGNRMVNWCPHCNTSISDAEVEYEEKDGSFWHLLYPVKETGEMLELATTRPETMLGDTAVAINGEDPRYAHLHGCHVILPLLNKEIPIVCDEHADMTKGTGVVKITPAHDPNDFEVGLRHDLPIVRVFTYDGRMTGAADKAAADAIFAAGKNTVNEPEVLDCGKYAGMTTLEARKAILADLKEGGFLKEIEPLKHEVGTCYRCHSTIEPMVSKQWFVKMEPLAKPAIESVEKGEIKFVPERFTKNYMNWMKGTRDWCISRQLWWGHQIPAYYCDDCGETVVAKDAPCTCPKCGGSKFTQDPDTLDTWFSSALWPFSTLGWPDEDSADLKYFYPTNTLVTGYDIIGFWVSRMIFSGLAYTGKAPFDTVCIHGIVRDSQGRKMSKSLGNGIDPLEVIAKYGADALRFMLLDGSTPGNDMRYSEKKVEAARNFANKLWNATRFVLMNLPEDFEPGLPADVGCVIMNVTSVSTLGKFLKTGIPLVTKRVTVEGDAIAKPQNIEVPIGTLYRDVIDACGGVKEGVELGKIIFGGPMMGGAAPSADFPVLKQNNGLLLFSKKAAALPEPSACIRCGRCIEACPMGLEPVVIAQDFANKDFAALKARCVDLCVACGSCTYACPAKRPVSQTMGLAKGWYMAELRKGGK